MKKCSICGKEFDGFGNNPSPLNRDLCCDECNQNLVIPLRMLLSPMNKRTAIIIKENGNIETRYFAEQPTLKEMQEMVGGYIEMPCFTTIPKHMQVICDEEGLLKHKSFNWLTQEMFGLQIVGDVVIMPKELLEDEE